MMRNATSLRRADACERCIFTPSEAVDKSFQVCQIWGTTPNCRERERGKKNMVARSTLCAQRLQVALGHFFHRAPITQFIFPPGFPIKLGRRQQNRCPPQQRETRRLVLQESVANSVGSPGKMARDSCGWGMDLKDPKSSWSHGSPLRYLLNSSKDLR